MAAGAAQVIVGVAGVPVPLSAMLCDAYPGAAAFRLLSVKTSEPLRLPATVGSKLIDNSHEVPAASVPGVANPLPITGHAEGPLPAKEKLLAMLGLFPVAGIGKVKSALPIFAIVTLCGLSVLVEPTVVEANPRLGGAEKVAFTTELPP
jgi:hypothetical protein